LNKHVPNILSLIRIPLSLSLFSVGDHPYLFATLIGLIGLSDVADGYIARKFQYESKTGARLDSLADLVFFTVVLLILFLKYQWIITEHLFLLVVVLLVKATAIVVSKVKYGKVAFIHTIANKITGALIFIVVLILPFGVSSWIITGTFLLSILSASEELAIIITSKELQLNKRSLLKSRSIRR
jgi:cardiolipin synthase (CMP-forming)